MKIINKKINKQIGIELSLKELLKQLKDFGYTIDTADDADFTIDDDVYLVDKEQEKIKIQLIDKVLEEEDIL